MNILLKKYELSIWRDIVDTEDGLNEKKIAVLASSESDILSQAKNVTLTLNVNGTQKLSFILYTNYTDFSDSIVREIRNPFLDILNNETKLKLYYNDTWYDFIINNIHEDTENHTISYEATDIFIEELSKNGFNLEFATELENNQGTAQDLVEKILEESEWRLDRSNSDKIIADVSEPLLQRRTLDNIQATSMETGETIIIPSNSVIYEFYSFSSAKYVGDILIIYPTPGASIIVDDENNIINFPNLLVSGAYIPYISTETDNITYRGKRLVRLQETRYNKILNRYVKKYSCNNEEDKVYEVDTKSVVHSPTLLTNYIVNSQDFENTTNWYSCNNAGISNVFYPEIAATTIISSINDSKRFLKMETGGIFYNNAYKINKSKILASDENARKLVVRLKYKPNSPAGAYASNFSYCMPSICYYTYATGSYIKGLPIYTIISSLHISDNYVYAIYELNDNITLDSVKNKDIGLFFTTNTTVYIEEAAMFLYATDINNNIIFPETQVSIETVLMTSENRIYDPELNQDAETEDDFIFKEIIDNETLQNNYTPVFSNDNEKITSISAKESNRFNLLQDVCEAFGCWIRIQVLHNEDGSIAEETVDGNIRKIKNVVIKKDVGQNNSAGFRYGVNLRSVLRQLASDLIVTKMIVQPNNNQYAERGFCTIQRASLNKLGQNVIYNFDYYMNKGVLNRNFVENKLQYLYTSINAYNRDTMVIEAQIETLSNTLVHAKADLEYKTAIHDAAAELQLQAKDAIKDYCGITYNGASTSSLSAYFGDWYNNDDSADYFLTNNITAYHQQDKIISDTLPQITALNEEIEEYEASLKEYQGQLELISQAIKDLLTKFDLTFILYIKEGTWKDDGYIDDNLYYLDALKVSNASAFPKVNYTINVIELSALDEYKGYNYNIGDRTYIEDTNFFGYKADKITPFHKEVIVTECTYYLDSPEKDTIKVQTYSTQFEDLFQRQTATVQSLQMALGSYNNVASILNSDGTLNKEIIQQTLDSNDFIFSNFNKPLLKWSDEGLRTFSAASLNKSIKFADDGVFATTDGGDNWVNLADGEGLSPDTLRVGNLYTDSVTIFTDKKASFRWDKMGITAYLPNYKNIGTDIEPLYVPNGYDYNSFVRFNAWGVYGYSHDNWLLIKDDETQQANVAKINEIYNNAAFSLTWRGLSINGAGGSVKIDTEDGIIIKNYVDGSHGGTNGFIIQKWLPDYDSSKIYNAGAQVNYNNNGYKALEDNITGPWDSTKWESIGTPMTNVFSADAAGDLTLAGKIYTSGGTIAGFTIGETAIYNNRPTLISDDPGIFLGVNGISLERYLAGTEETPSLGLRISITPLSSSNIVQIDALLDEIWTPIFVVDQNGNITIQGNADIYGTLNGKIINDRANADSLNYVYTHPTEGLKELSIFPQPYSSTTTEITYTLEILTVNTSIGHEGSWLSGIECNIYANAASPVPVTLQIKLTNSRGLSETIEEDFIFPANKISCNYKLSFTSRYFYSTATTTGEIIGSGTSGATIEGYMISTNFYPSINNTYTLGTSGNTWNNVYTNTVTQTSDKSLKYDIDLISDKYSKLFDKLIPCEYKYKNDYKTRLGFIAQDISDAMIELNMERDELAALIGENGSYGIAYSEFIALCVKEIQKLKAEVKELKSKI